MIARKPNRAIVDLCGSRTTVRRSVAILYIFRILEGLVLATSAKNVALHEAAHKIVISHRVSRYSFPYVVQMLLRLAVELSANLGRDDQRLVCQHWMLLRCGISMAVYCRRVFISFHARCQYRLRTQSAQSLTTCCRTSYHIRLCMSFRPLEPRLQRVASQLHADALQAVVAPVLTIPD